PSPPRAASTPPIFVQGGRGRHPTPVRSISPAARISWISRSPHRICHFMKDMAMTSERRITSGSQPTTETLRTQLANLKLSYLLEYFESLTQQADAEQWSRVEY